MEVKKIHVTCIAVIGACFILVLGLSLWTSFGNDDGEKIDENYQMLQDIATKLLKYVSRFIVGCLGLKSHSSALLNSRYILRLGQRGRRCFCAAFPNRKMYLEIRSADEWLLRFSCNVLIILTSSNP